MNKLQIGAFLVWLAALLVGGGYATALKMNNDKVYSAAIKTKQFTPEKQRQCIERKKSAVLVGNALLLFTFALNIYPGFKRNLQFFIAIVFLILLTWHSQYLSP